MTVERLERLRIAVEGVVQGVGFRPFVASRRATTSGFVINRGGDVVIEAEAEPTQLCAFVGRPAPGHRRRRGSIAWSRSIATCEAR